MYFFHSLPNSYHCCPNKNMTRFWTGSVLLEDVMALCYYRNLLRYRPRAQCFRKNSRACTLVKRPFGFCLIFCNPWLLTQVIPSPCSLPPSPAVVNYCSYTRVYLGESHFLWAGSKMTTVLMDVVVLTCSHLTFGAECYPDKQPSFPRQCCP